MKFRKILPLFVLWIGFFNIAHANVRINEIAWMGTTISGTNEWIELSNEGDTSVDLSGWSIIALDGSPSITLAGSVAPRGYFLIERTDDTTVPDIIADEVAPFGSGLSNAGETLYLKDASGSLIDTAIGGSNWANIGGDNTTKETAQRTTTGWVTGVPTPRAANVSHGEVLGVSTEISPSVTVAATQSLNTSSGGATTALATPTYPRKDISVFAGDDKSTFTHTPVSFVGTAYGLYDEALPSATYRWNFGDGASGDGKEISHHYDFPGNYIATLEVFWSNRSKTDRVSVAVTAPGVVIGEMSSGEGGFVQLVNRANQEVEISLWRLHASNGTEFIIPRNTFISASQSLRLPNAVTRLDLSGGLELRYPDGVIVFSSSVPQNNTRQIRGITEAVTFVPKSVVREAAKITPKEIHAAPIGADSASVVLWQGGEKHPDALVNGGIFASKNMKWVFFALFIFLIIFAGFIVSRSSKENSIASEYAIIEDIIEGRDEFAKE